jgi:hypothetical protein
MTDHGKGGDVDMIELARITLQKICRDKNSPAAARAQAAKTLLELAGALKNPGPRGTEKPAFEMTIVELDQRLKSLLAKDETAETQNGAGKGKSIESTNDS